MPKKLKRVVIKEELVELTGNFVKAVILNQLIYWSERIYDFDKFIREEKERAKQEGKDIKMPLINGWIYKSAEELAEETMLNKTPKTIRNHLKELIEEGYISERHNPNYKWDRKMQYRVNISKIAKDLINLGYPLDGYALTEFFQEKEMINASENFSDAFVKKKNASEKKKNGSENFSDPFGEMKNQTGKKEKAITEIITETITETTKQPVDVDKDIVNNLNSIFSFISNKKNESLIMKLLSEYDKNYIVEQLKYMMKYATQHEIPNPEGFLIQAVKENYAGNSYNEFKKEKPKNKSKRKNFRDLYMS